MASTDAPDIAEDPREPEERRGWLGLVLTAFIVALALAIAGGWFVLRDDESSGPPSGWPRNIESSVTGHWVGEASELQVRFTAAREYQILNYRGQTTVGEYTINEDNLIEVPVRFQDYDGVWYFEPAQERTLKLDVEELELSEVFIKFD